MKRGAIELSQEFLKEIFKGRIPDDFLLSGVTYDEDRSTVMLHGYSEQFHDTLEGAHHPVRQVMKTS